MTRTRAGPDLGRSRRGSRPSRVLRRQLHTAAATILAIKPGVARTYILCTQGKEDQDLPGYVQPVRSDPRWRFIELAAGHGAHLTTPQQLADLLAQVA
jgi:hypothetical protein